MRLSPELEAQLLAMPGVVVGGKPAPEKPPVDDESAEKAFQEAVIKVAREHGWSEYHTYNSRRSKSGWFDLVLVRPPVIIFAELKSAGGRTTAAQERWIELLRECQQRVYVWKPENWEQIRELLA